MLNPSIRKLIEHYENRYRLVTDVAKKARKVSEESAERGEIIIEKPVSIAIDKIAEEKGL
ncbi:MAG: DNA-directed RNA polymerase subunit omega [Oscillospiraceae bacterium]|nr:DNA-directed RNA polymerase subunit omega [Oscillospiraceae bacterium]